MILENLKYMAGVLFFSMADLILLILWILIVPGIVIGVVKGIARIRKEDGEE